MAAEYNITINKYSDFKRTFQVKEDGVILDITDFTFTGALKENFQATSSTSFTTEVTDGPAGLFSIILTDVTTGAMDPGTWVYDIIMSAPITGDKTRLLEGKAFVKQGVTE
jgi:hypothetical protein